ncbi:MAG TPA: hypothetical protein VKF16_12070 [Candidatus Dormibacteraeota bacterium]|nr:hypothetical protein [Candidatus Dormibacteraeota bacterium]
MVVVHAQKEGVSWRCEVSVDHAGQRSRHLVTVTPSDVSRWAEGGDGKDVERLVAKSFDFLLEREPPSAILATFDLSVIQSYFPDYDRAFKRS